MQPFQIRDKPTGQHADLTTRKRDSVICGKRRTDLLPLPVVQEALQPDVNHNVVTNDAAREDEARESRGPFFQRHPETHTRTDCRDRTGPWSRVTLVRCHVFLTRVEPPHTEHRSGGFSASTSAPATICDRCRHSSCNRRIARLKIAISARVTGQPFFFAPQA